MQELKINRLEALTDGIFAIAMTLLVLTIDIPESTKEMTGANLHQTLLNQSSQLINYLLSFLLLSVFWTINHRQFNHLTKTNSQHIWINIMGLIFICLVPYTTSIKSSFPADWMSNLFFNVNMLIISILYLINWNYISTHRKLTDETLSASAIQSGRIRTLLFALVALIAASCSFIIPEQSSTLYLLVPVLKFVERKYYTPKTKSLKNTDQL